MLPATCRTRKRVSPTLKNKASCLHDPCPGELRVRLPPFCTPTTEQCPCAHPCHTRPSTGPAPSAFNNNTINPADVKQARKRIFSARAGANGSRRNAALSYNAHSTRRAKAPPPVDHISIIINGFSQAPFASRGQATGSAGKPGTSGASPCPPRLTHRPLNQPPGCADAQLAPPIT